jgi:uncharacterized protein (DUF433 family)
MATEKVKPTRIQFNLRPDQTRVLDTLEGKLATRSRADLLQEAIGTLWWVMQETARGRKVVSINPIEMSKLGHVVELSNPSIAMAATPVYDHLIALPHPWRRQLSLKGRNMTVGQLMSAIRAEKMSVEEAAEDFELPLAQVQEAIAYYEDHRDLVDTELRQEKHLLEARGYAVGPSHLPR